MTSTLSKFPLSDLTCAAVPLFISTKVGLGGVEIKQESAIDWHTDYSNRENKVDKEFTCNI
jgi:hypothetical protein